jgi:hypothetical protein
LPPASAADNSSTTDIVESSTSFDQNTTIVAMPTEESSTETGLIVGIVIALLLLICLIAFVIRKLILRRNEKENNDEFHQNTVNLPAASWNAGAQTGIVRAPAPDQSGGWGGSIVYSHFPDLADAEGRYSQRPALAHQYEANSQQRFEDAESSRSQYVDHAMLDERNRSNHYHVINNSEL